MTDEGKLQRYDTGIYFIPKPSPFRLGSQLVYASAKTAAARILNRT